MPLIFLSIFERPDMLSEACIHRFIIHADATKTLATHFFWGGMVQTCAPTLILSKWENDVATLNISRFPHQL